MLGTGGVATHEDGWLLSLLESCRCTDEELKRPGEGSDEAPEEGLASPEEGSAAPEEDSVPGVAAALEPGLVIPLSSQDNSSNAVNSDMNASNRGFSHWLLESAVGSHSHHIHTTWCIWSGVS